MDDIDRKIILATQEGLPVVAEPYAAVAKQVGIETSEVIARLQTMLDTGGIRRIGVVPNHYALGYKFNGMTVWNVPDDMVDELGPKIGALDCVSHCYQRPRFLPDWPYNLFAMVHGRTEAAAQVGVDAIRNVLGDHCQGHMTLFSTRILKKTGMRFGG